MLIIIFPFCLLPIVKYTLSLCTHRDQVARHLMRWVVFLESLIPSADLVGSITETFYLRASWELVIRIFIILPLVPFLLIGSGNEEKKKKVCIERFSERKMLRNFSPFLFFANFRKTDFTCWLLVLGRLLSLSVSPDPVRPSSSSFCFLSGCSFVLSFSLSPISLPLASVAAPVFFLELTSSLEISC